MAKHQVKVRFAVEIRDLGSRIQAIRIAKGISQEELADVASISKNSVNRIESGRINPTAGTLFAIAKGLNTDIGELFKKD